MEIDVAFRAARPVIDSSEKILLVTHSRPDGDAVGATSGMALHLKGSGKDVTVFCADPVPVRYDFAPGSEIFSTDRALLKKEYDLLIMLDCGSLGVTGVANEIAALPGPIKRVIFDHHHSRESFDGVGAIDSHASSTGEIVYRYLRSVNAPITGDIATALLTGIYFDTTAFSNALTSRTALAAAADLLRCGANAHLVVSRVFQNESLDNLRLWGAAMARLKHDEKLGISSTAIFMAEEEGVSSEVSQRLSDLLGGWLDAPVQLILKERPGGLVRCSLRATTAGGRDVSALAKRMGGGGHIGAAGFTVPGRIVEGENGWRVEKN